MTDLVSFLLVVDAPPGDVCHAQCGHQGPGKHAPHVVRPPHVEGGRPRLPHQGVPGAPGHLAITRVQPAHAGYQQNVTRQGYTKLFLIDTSRASNAGDIILLTTRLNVLLMTIGTREYCSVFLKSIKNTRQLVKDSKASRNMSYVTFKSIHVEQAIKYL